MISIEQIAHDLTMVYLNNRFGVEVKGSFSVSSSTFNDRVTDVSGSGYVDTVYLPKLGQPNFVKVKTGEKGLLGFEKKVTVQSGYMVDSVFTNMIDEYKKVYDYFVEMLTEK